MPERTAPRAARKTVDKALRLLHAFSHERPTYSVGELSRVLGEHKSVVSRLASELCRWRLLDRDPVSRRLRIGVGAFRLGTLYASRQNLERLVTPFLGQLVARTGHSAHAVVLDGTRALVIATVESPSALRVIMRIGEHRPLHATAAGKLFLAYAGPGLLYAAAEDPGFVRFTADTITDLQRLRTQLAAARRQGLGTNQGEHTPGAGGVAAPVFDATGQMAAAVASVYPLSVVDDRARKRIGLETRRTASRISAALRSSGADSR